MNVVFTILIGFVVLITAILFAGFSMCALGSGIPVGTRATLVFIGLASLAVMFGGVYWIARINRSKEPPE
jgi:membrane protein implicated in regulation of membrane protease activity